jgi:hypothetical protein
LDQNISDVLNRSDIDDASKLRLYQQALNRFLVNRRVVEDELNKPVQVKLAESSPVEQTKFEQPKISSKFEQPKIFADTPRKSKIRTPQRTVRTQKKKKYSPSMWELQ